MDRVGVFEVESGSDSGSGNDERRRRVRRICLSRNTTNWTKINNRLYTTLGVHLADRTDGTAYTARRIVGATSGYIESISDRIAKVCRNGARVVFVSDPLDATISHPEVRIRNARVAADNINSRSIISCLLALCVAIYALLLLQQHVGAPSPWRLVYGMRLRA